MVGDARVAYSRKEVDERGADSIAHGGVGVECWANSRPEMVRGSSSAECEPAIGRALPVDDEVPGVVKCWTVGESDRVPRVVGQWLGGDHHRVERNHVAMLAVDVRRVTLGGLDDVLRRNRSPVGGDTASAKGRCADRGENAHTIANHGAPDAVGEFGRVYRDAMWSEHCSGQF